MGNMKCSMFWFIQILRLKHLSDGLTIFSQKKRWQRFKSIDGKRSFSDYLFRTRCFIEIWVLFFFSKLFYTNSNRSVLIICDGHHEENNFFKSRHSSKAYDCTIENTSAVLDKQKTGSTEWKEIDRSFVVFCEANCHCGLIALGGKGRALFLFSTDKSFNQSY